MANDEGHVEVRVLVDASLSMDAPQENNKTLLENVLLEAMDMLHTVVVEFPTHHPTSDLHVAVDMFAMSYVPTQPLVLEATKHGEWMDSVQAYVGDLLARALALGCSVRGGTALYDSVVQAYALFDRKQTRAQLIVVTDGVDTCSSLCHSAESNRRLRQEVGELAVARAQLTRPGVSVAYLGTSDIGQTLNGISEASADGAFKEADAAPPVTFDRTSSTALKGAMRSVSAQVSRSLSSSGGGGPPPPSRTMTMADQPMADEDDDAAADDGFCMVVSPAATAMTSSSAAPPPPPVQRPAAQRPAAAGHELRHVTFGRLDDSTAKRQRTGGAGMLPPHHLAAGGAGAFAAPPIHRRSRTTTS